MYASFSSAIRLFALGGIFLGLGIIFSKSFLFSTPTVKILGVNQQYISSSDSKQAGDSVETVESKKVYSGSININNATLNELDVLPGIGPKTGQKIIDHRPYSTINELISKKAISKSLFEKIQSRLTVE